MHCLKDLKFEQLPSTERLVLITLRTRFDGRRGAASLETMYRIACGLARVERAVASFESMVCALLAGSRRPFRVKDLADASVSPDEHCLVALLAVHQCNERVQAEARARWLVRPKFLDPLQSSTNAFAHTLARSGCKLSRCWIEPDKPKHHRVPAPCVPVPVKPSQNSNRRIREEASR